MPPNDKHPEEIAKEIEFENREWLESLDYVYENQGPERVRQLLHRLQAQAQRRGVPFHFTANTPYINTIPVTPAVVSGQS
jgi:pyruvate dehydrogenase E1 component